MGQHRAFRFQLLPQHFKVGEVETWTDAAAHQGVGAVASSCLPASTRHHMEWIIPFQPGLVQSLTIWLALEQVEISSIDMDPCFISAAYPMPAADFVFW